MSNNPPAGMPFHYGQTARDGGTERQTPALDISIGEEEVPHSRSTREHPRGTNVAPEPTQPLVPRNGSVRSNPPTSWRQEARVPRGEEHLVTENSSGKHQKRQPARFAEPASPSSPDGDLEHYSRPQAGIRNSRQGDYDRTSGQYARYAEDYSDAERGYTARLSGDSRKLDENPPLTRESEKPLNSSAKSPTNRPAFSRTFTQQFRETEPFATVDFKNLSPEERKEMIKLPLYHWMDSSFKNHVVAALGELVGTTMFLFFAFAGTAVANIPLGTGSSNSTTTGTTGFSIDVQLYVALAFGFSLMVNVWVFYRISGGLFNPAVTLALLLVQVITPARAGFVFAAQVAGGIAAAGLASVMFPTELNVRTSLAPGVSVVQGVFIELVLTFELVFTIFMLAAEKHRARFIAPIGIGLALFIAELVGVYYTGGSLNPARSFGPCVVAASFNGEHWIYWVGPLGGAVVASAFFKVIKFLQYEAVNPGQDSYD